MEFEKTPYRFEAIDIIKAKALKCLNIFCLDARDFPYFDKDNNGTIEVEEFCEAYSSSMPCDMTGGIFRRIKKMEKDDEKDIISD